MVLVLIWIGVPNAALLACVRMDGFKGVDTRWRFVYGEEQLLYISNGGRVYPVVSRATVSPFFSDCEYPLASSLIIYLLAKKPTPDVVISPQIGLLFHNLLIHRPHRLVTPSIAKPPDSVYKFHQYQPTTQIHKTQTIIDSFRFPTSSPPKSLLRT